MLLLILGSSEIASDKLPIIPGKVLSGIPVITHWKKKKKNERKTKKKKKKKKKKKQPTQLAIESLTTEHSSTRNNLHPGDILPLEASP